MRETMNYLKRYFTEALDVAKIQWQSFVVALSIVGVIYYISLYVPPGWGSYFAMFPGAFIIAVTALARVNDIGPERMSKRWQFRKISLIMAGGGAVMFMGTPFSTDPSFPTWRAVIIMWGVAGAWLTTPGHPPWDYYITGRYRFLTHPPEEPRSPLERVALRVVRPQTREEILEAQEKYEREQELSNGRRRGDGEGP